MGNMASVVISNLNFLSQILNPQQQNLQKNSTTLKNAVTPSVMIKRFQDPLQVASLIGHSRS